MRTEIPNKRKTPKKRRDVGLAALTQAEYEKLAEFRYQLARFLRRRKDAALDEGLQVRQYELLLAVAGLPDDKEPTIKEVSFLLRLEHHTVVELANRLEQRGYLTRAASPLDGRAVLLHVTRSGRSALDRIVRFSFSELREEAPGLIKSLRRILQS
jgi:DNA-binding MarR family transcriptional regulator